MAFGKIYGIGVGPGDPGLITVKAVKILTDVPVVVAPKAAEDAGSFALSIVEGYIDAARQKVITPLFPMSMDKAVLDKAWSDAAEVVAAELSAGRDVAFLTLGDPSLYSTYSYILTKIKALVPGIENEIIPGVSSISLAAARAGVDLALGSERLAIMPVGRDMESLKVPLSNYDTVVLMKVNKSFGKLVSLLEEMGLLSKAVYVSRCGTDKEKIIRDLKSIGEDELDYLSIVIVKK